MGITAGRWGCGVFGGVPAHKFMQQLVAARFAGCDLRFSTFGTPDGCDELLLAVQLAGAAADAEALFRVLFRASAIAMAQGDPRAEFLRTAKRALAELAGGDAGACSDHDHDDGDWGGDDNLV